MTQIDEKEAEKLGIDTFGGCPQCGRNDGFINVGRNHWFVCDLHKTKWWIGSNWFACWRSQTPDDWKWGAEKLTPYEEVEPVFSLDELRRRRSESS